MWFVRLAGPGGTERPDWKLLKMIGIICIICKIARDFGEFKLRSFFRQLAIYYPRGFFDLEQIKPLLLFPHSLAIHSSCSYTFLSLTLENTYLRIESKNLYKIMLNWFSKSGAVKFSRVLKNVICCRIFLVDEMKEWTWKLHSKKLEKRDSGYKEL